MYLFQGKSRSEENISQTDPQCETKEEKTSQMWVKFISTFKLISRCPLSLLLKKSLHATILNKYLNKQQRVGHKLRPAISDGEGKRETCTLNHVKLVHCYTTIVNFIQILKYNDIKTHILQVESTFSVDVMIHLRYMTSFSTTY